MNDWQKNYINYRGTNSCSGGSSGLWIYLLLLLLVTLCPPLAIIILIVLLLR